MEFFTKNVTSEVIRKSSSCELCRMRFVFSHMVLGVCSSNSLGMFFLGDNINRLSLTWWWWAEICLKNF